MQATKRQYPFDYSIAKLFLTILVGLFLLLSISLLAEETKPTQLEKDMAAIEKAYLPALMTSKEGEPGKALKTAEKFQNSFNSFSAKYKSTDSVWLEHLDRIKPHIDTAVDSIRTKGPDQKAHDELEQYRLIMLDLRTQKSIYSFMDLLTDFHSTMEQLVEEAGVQSNKIDWSQLSSLIATAKQSWSKVIAGKFNGPLYMMDSRKTELFKTALNREQERLADLDNIIKNKDEKQLPPAAQAVKSAFKNVVRKFID